MWLFYDGHDLANRVEHKRFWNLAYFDKPYFSTLFEGFVFPDGTTMQWESVSWLQKRFMKWFNQERLKNVLTFPVESLSLLNDGKDFVDQEWADFAAEMLAEGHSFFIYTSDSVDSLASCCYSKDTDVLIKDSRGAYLITFEELKHKQFDKNGYRIFNNGKWSKGRLVELPNRQMYKVVLSNGAEMVLTDNHRNNTLRGVTLTQDLTTNDYIMMSSTPVDTYREADEHLTYAQGFAIGAFAGDGSFGSERELSDGTKQIADINYSLSAKKQWIVDILREADKQFGGAGNVIVGKEYNNVIPVRLYSKNLAHAIMRWTNWSRETHAANKELNMDCILQSIEFRKGIIDGWLATGGNMNSARPGTSLRGYTTSEKLLRCMQAVCTSVGYITSVDVDERMDNPVFRGVEYNKDYPVYILLKYADYKHTKLGKDRCKFKDNSYWMRVKSITPVDYHDNVFCFEMDDPEDDKFTLPNGIHNYNCRLRNGISENTFSYTLGAGGIATGSKCVMTMNLNRLIQDATRDLPEDTSLEDKLKVVSESVKEQTLKIHKYLLAFNSILMDMKDAHMIPIYDSGFVTPEKQYLTVGINGFVEAAQYLGIKVRDSDEYRAYAESVMKPIYDVNKAAKTKEIMFNTEFVPAENLGVKNAKWDKAGGYYVPRDCYNSYFYLVEDETTNVVDKFRLHGEKYTKYLDGGQCKPGYHCKPDEPAQGCAEKTVLTVNREEYRAKLGDSLEGVTTNRDECSDVPAETGAVGKRQAGGKNITLAGRDSLYACDICHRCVSKTNIHTRIIDGTRMNLCGKHYAQYFKHGRFLDCAKYTQYDQNDFIIDEHGSWIITRYRDGRESGRFLIETDDLSFVLQKKWRRWKDFYYSGNIKPVQISRYILGLNNGDKRIVDHINGNRVDNRRSNLRIVNASQNAINKSLERRNTSGIAGVRWEANRKKYAVEISKEHHRIHLSRWQNLEDACYARYIAELFIFGEYRSDRNDDVLLSIIASCKNKDEIKTYVMNKLHKVGVTLQSQRASNQGTI